MRAVLYVFILIAFVSCVQQEISRDHVTETEINEVNHEEVIEADSTLLLAIRDTLFKADLVPISEVDGRIIIDLRYATENNFIGRQLYDTLQEAFLQFEVLERLVKCQDYLDSLKPGYRLKVFDAVRPVQVQSEMWNALDTVPPLNRGKYVSNPAFGSVHNFGAAVDITICDENGEELDMGAGYDDFRPIAFPSKEAHFLKSGELSSAQYENRRLLRSVMKSQRFSNIPSEWWHFNAFSRNTAERKYRLLYNESGKTIKWHTIPPPTENSVVRSLDTISDDNVTQ
jgi:D-alanyl-D-alanine dipeptidase